MNPRAGVSGRRAGPGLWKTLFAFLKEKVPPGPRLYRLGGNMLRSLCWLQFLPLLFLGVFGVAWGVIALVFTSEALPVGLFLGAAAVIFIGLIAIVPIGLLYVLSWIYRAWVGLQPAGRTGAVAVGAILAGLGVLQGLPVVLFVFAAGTIDAGFIRDDDPVQQALNVLGLALAAAMPVMGAILLYAASNPLVRDVFEGRSSRQPGGDGGGHYYACPWCGRGFRIRRIPPVGTVCPGCSMRSAGRSDA